MFDITDIDKSSTTNHNTIEINSVNGILAKSTPKSKIIRFHLNMQTHSSI